MNFRSRPLVIHVLVKSGICLALLLAQVQNTHNARAQTAVGTKPIVQFTNDFSVRDWLSGPSRYGNIWYQNDEYHMRATRGRFIVIYAPDRKAYYTENAIVRIAVRSVQPDSTPTGYGLVVHGEKKKGRLEDYGFVIYTGPDPKYKIVMHKGGVEQVVVGWTASKDLKTGTARNLLEVRTTHQDLAFYINEQYQTRISDTEGWLRGRVGFYTSDIWETAFDDLYITREQTSAEIPQKSNGAKAVLEPVDRKTDLYPADADAPKEIQEALRRAVTEKKRVLLIFGGNWCYDCHVLDRALHEGVAGKIVSESFILVHVDIGEGEKNPDLVKTYHIPLNKGVPAVAVLNSDGKTLYSSGNAEFESARTMLKKDLVAFLNRWKTSGR